MIASPMLTKVVWGAVIFLALLGVVVAARRTLVLLKPEALKTGANPAADLDSHFANRRVITLLHVIPGALFMVLGPLQFIASLRKRYPEVHRWSGRIFLTASAIIGITGLMMARGNTVGGWDEKSAIFLFGSFFLFALVKALRDASRIRNPSRMDDSGLRRWPRCGHYSTHHGNLFRNCHRAWTYTAAARLFRHRILDWIYAAGDRR
jgi:uncharacterized membrane protein